jgi:hypothetical protein
MKTAQWRAMTRLRIADLLIGRIGRIGLISAVSSCGLPIGLERRESVKLELKIAVF